MHANTLNVMDALQVMLDTQQCDSHFKITVVNSRWPALKYLHYRCDLEVLVPDGVVLPGVCTCLCVHVCTYLYACV